MTVVVGGDEQAEWGTAIVLGTGQEAGGTPAQLVAGDGIDADIGDGDTDLLDGIDRRIGEGQGHLGVRCGGRVRVGVTVIAATSGQQCGQAYQD
ncbi:hypothetical protein D3C80_1287600 [compost metagenome]